MSAGTTTYVPVIGKAAKNTNDIGSGNTAGGFFIHWSSVDGWTGKGNWYYDESYLHIGWPLVAASKGYQPTKEGFLDYMATNPENINDILVGWTSYGKNSFKNQYEDILQVRGAGAEQDQNYNPYGCIEYV